MAGIYDFPGFLSDFVRGTTKDFVIRMKLEDVPMDITGSKFYISFGYDINAQTPPEFVVTIDPPSDPVNGETSGKITSAQTASLKVGHVYYSVRWVNALGDPYVIDMGKIEVQASISDQTS